MINASAKIRIVIVLYILFEHTPCDSDLNMTPNDLDIIIRTKLCFYAAEITEAPSLGLVYMVA